MEGNLGFKGVEVLLWKLALSFSRGVNLPYVPKNYFLSQTNVFRATESIPGVLSLFPSLLGSTKPIFNNYSNFVHIFTLFM